MRSDVYTGGFICAFSTFMYFTASKLPEGMFGTLGAGFFPKIIFGALIILSLLLMVQSFIANPAKKQEKTNSNLFSAEKYTLVAVAFILFFLFVIALNYLGFVIASLLFLPSLMWILGPKTKASLTPILLTSIGMTGVIYFIFTKVLKVFLPSGTLF